VRPLALYFWSSVWTLAAWCELRKDFRTFRIDRMDDVQVLEREFVQKKGQRLEDYLRRVMNERASATQPDTPLRQLTSGSPATLDATMTSK
jgi:predicted DNA-binding transcriptional regulator YafY